MTMKNRIVREADVPPGELLANPFNYRMHPKFQREVMGAALKEIGWLQRVMVNQTTGHMIDGHLRVELALEQGEPSVPVSYVEVTEAEERKALATFDPITGLAETDNELLQALLGSVKAEEETLQEYLDSMKDEDELPPDPEEDDIPPVPTVPAVKKGEVWILGEHRLICGDTTKPADIDVLMPEGESAGMVWTDPPYNVDYEGGSGAKTKIENDKMGNEAFRKFLLESFVSLVRRTVEGGCIYIAHADSEGRNFRAAMEDAGWLLKQCLIWVKNSATLSRQDYNWQHEPILYGWKPGAGHFFAGDFTLTTVIDDQKAIDEMTKEEMEIELREMRALAPVSVIRVDKPHVADLHPTMKPVALVRRCVNASSKHGDIVLDGFGGSGTTLIACETIGRRARLVEFDPIFCDVIIRRWQEYSGKQAHREDDGVLFDEISEEADAA